MSFIVADISGHNTNYVPIIDNSDAVIVKVSEGTSYINPLAVAQIETTIQKGKLLGLYHFIIGGSDVRAQADYFYNNAKNYADKPGVKLVLDWERPQGYPALTGDEPKAFFDRLAELTGKNADLYIGHQDVISNAYDWSDVKDHGFWVAGYPSNDGSGYSSALQAWADKNYFSNPKYKGINVVMWQFASVPYDQSIHYADKDAWLKSGTRVGDAAPASAPAPAPAPTPTPKSAIDQFKANGNAFTAYNGFRADEIKQVNGIWQAINYDLAGGRNFDWVKANVA